MCDEENPREEEMGQVSDGPGEDNADIRDKHREETDKHSERDNRESENIGR